jgi:cytochrome c-type biogenesis protein CcmH/NrfG
LFIRFILFFLLSAFLLAACSPIKPVTQTLQYHPQSKPDTAKKPLNGLQIKALQLMSQSEFEQSILYLQRAIKVEPRDPVNWHYLAQNYWQLKDFSSCRSMIQRARSYSLFDDDLNRANDALLKQCTPGN